MRVRLALACVLALVALLLSPSRSRATSLQCCGSSSGGGGGATGPTGAVGATGPTGPMGESETIHATDFGALCDASTDDTTAIQNAIDSATAGGVVELPVGACLVTALSLNVDGLTLRGQGTAESNKATVIRCNVTTGTCITMGSACQDCTIEKMTLKAHSTPTTLTLVDASATSRSTVRDVNLTTGLYCVGFKNVSMIDDVNLYGPVAGASCRGISSVNQIQARMFGVLGNWDTAIDGMIVIEQTGVSQPDSFNLADVIIAQSSGSGPALKIKAADATKAPRWVQIVNSQFEAGQGATDYAIELSNVRDFKCSNCYVIGGNNAVRVSGGPGPITFENSIMGASQHDVFYHDADVTTELIGVTVTDGSQALTNVDSGVYLSANSRRFSMIGGTASGNLITPGGANQKYGIEIDAAADLYHFDDVICEGNVTSCQTGYTGANDDLAWTGAVTFFPGTTGTLLSDTKINVDAPQTVLYPSFPASTASQFTLLKNASPITFTSTTGTYTFADASPVISAADTVGVVSFNQGGSIDRTGTTGGNLYGVSGLSCGTLYTSSTTGGPLLQDCVFDHSIVRQQGGATATQNTWVPITVTSKPSVVASGNGVLTLGRATGMYNLWAVIAERNAQCTANVSPYTCCTGSGTGTCGTTSAVTVTRAEGFHFLNPTLTGAGAAVTNAVGITIDDLTSGGTQNSSLESLGAAVDMRHAGPARFGATGAPTAGKDLDVQGDTLIDGLLDVGDGIADLSTTVTRSIIDMQPTVDMSGDTAVLRGGYFAPVVTQTAQGFNQSTLIGYEFSPAATHSGAGGSVIPNVQGFKVAGTSTTTSSASFLTSNLLLHTRTYTSATANTTVGSITSINDQPTMTSTATSVVGGVNTGALITVSHAPIVVMNGAGGGLTISNDIGLSVGGSYTQTAGTLIVTNRKGLDYLAPTDASNVLVNNIAVDVAAQTKGTTERTALRSAIAANAAAYFLHDTGGAQMAVAGKFTTYNGITTAGPGVPIIVSDSGVSATKTANFTSLDFTPPAVAGRYRVQSVISTTSSTNTGTLQCTIDYTTSQGSALSGHIVPIAAPVGTVGATATSAASSEAHCLPVEITINNAAAHIIAKVVITGTVSYTVLTTIEQLS